MNLVYEIRLVIDSRESTYIAKWIDSGGQETQPFVLLLPLDAEDTNELRWYLEGYLQFPGAGDHARARGVEIKLKEWGRALFEAIFGTGEGREVYRNLIAATQAGHVGLITLGTLEPAVLMQPWELLRDTRGPLALQGITFRRQLKGVKRWVNFNVTLPLRILLIVSRPKDIGFIDPRNSILPVLDALDQLPGQAKVEFCDPPTLKRLEEIISQARKTRRPYHMVHFDGHGTYLPLTGVGALAFEDEQAKTDLVTGKRLGDLLVRLHIPLVLLEACRSSDLSNKPVFGSVAPALLESGVGSVVAFSHSVHIRAARILVERFYKELVEGQSIGFALQEARAALLADPTRFLHLGPNAETIHLEDWFIPQLYQIGDEPFLVMHDLRASLEEKVAFGIKDQSEHLFGFPSAPLYKFHGRALELLELERAFRRYPAVVITGMGGMGKTALAREAATWWLRTERFDAAVFISFEQRIGAERAIQLIGQVLEGDDFARRSSNEIDPEGQWQTAVRLFHQKRVLVVWDNFESTLAIYQPPNSVSPLEIDQRESFLLSFSAEARSQLLLLYHDLTLNRPQGRLLVTCRSEETGLPAIKEFPLRGLTRFDSFYLLAAVLDLKNISVERPGYERIQIEALLTLLHDHPLSLELVAPHLKTLTPAVIRANFASLMKRFESFDAFEDRNQSLLASLEFSCQHLSESARAVLPWFAWFEGGVFENLLLGFIQIDPVQWAVIRTELEATALIKVEEKEAFFHPYLHFHPTLPYTIHSEGAPNFEDARERFVGIYLLVEEEVNTALTGQQPAVGMDLITYEEANFRRALEHALEWDARSEGQVLANILHVYLQMAGRLRERDALTQWIHKRLSINILDIPASDSIRQHAWTRFTQGAVTEALQMVQALLIRLQTEGLAGGEDPAFQIALTYRSLGRILINNYQPELALEPSQQAIARFAALSGDNAQDNLSVALGDLANVYYQSGQFDEALFSAEQGLEIQYGLKHDRTAASFLGQIAQIFVAKGQYIEAHSYYTESLRIAKDAGDLDLQSVNLQHLGSLHADQGDFGLAVDSYKQALILFVNTNNLGEEMRTCHSLAQTETSRGQLDAAEAWYAKSRELALKLKDRRQLAIIAESVGHLYLTRAEQIVDLVTRTFWLHRAIASVNEGLTIELEMKNKLGEASCYFQLGVFYRAIGNLNEAEKITLKALQIHELLKPPNIYKTYANLAYMTYEQGNFEAAAHWEAKYEIEREKLNRANHNEKAKSVESLLHTPLLLQKLVPAILELAQACYTIRVGQADESPRIKEAIAPAPLCDMSAFLKAVVTGCPLLPVPNGLPPELDEIMERLEEAVQTL